MSVKVSKTVRGVEMEMLFNVVVLASICIFTAFETGKFAQGLISPHSSPFEPPSENNVQNTTGIQMETYNDHQEPYLSTKGAAETFQQIGVSEASQKLIHELKRQTEVDHGRVAFFARLSYNVSELGASQTIPFDEVILNEGQGFKSAIHVFICPTNGVYLFQCAAMSELNSSIELDVVKDGRVLFAVYVSSVRYNHGYDQGFNAGIVECDQGQSVWVRVRNHRGTKVKHKYFTTFSGYLLWKTGTKSAAQIGQIVHAANSNVAFNTLFARDKTIGNSQRIPFDTITLNEGQAFDSASDVFTCPLSGVYMFESALHAGGDGQLEADIVKDGVPFVRMYSATSKNNMVQHQNHDQGFNGGITRCWKGQQIFVRAHQGNLVLQYQLTTFSGYLIWEIERGPNTTIQADVGLYHVAFQAYLSTGATGLGKLQTIPFDRVSLNEGQAFDTFFHAFICPVNGVYMFRSALMSESNSHIETEVVKDGTPFIRMYASSVPSSNFDQGFNAGIIQCDKGERVWVRVSNHEGTSARHFNSTTFSGHLLWET